MAYAGIRVRGLDELRKQLRAAENPGLPNALKAANKSAAELVVARALPLTPKGSTGRLAGSVRALGAQRTGRVRAGNARVPYAGAIHWGRKVGNVGRPPGNRRGPNPIKGRPFLWEAANKSRLQVAATYERAIERLVVATIDRGK